MKILSVVGARPQFIKAGPLSKELGKKFKEVLVHTGQHYDYGMSPVFFKELSIPKPNYNLNVGSGSHSGQIGRMVVELTKVVSKEKPGIILVYGDTNSTLAGSLVAAKFNINLAHVEAGLRSFNKNMPEEINRIVSDRLSQFLFCPTKTAVENLKKEGVKGGIFYTGDVMYDALWENRKIADKKSSILARLNLKPRSYLFAPVHRAENTDIKKNLENIINAFGKSGDLIIFPIHPRTKKALRKFGIKNHENIKLVEPLGYLDSLKLQANSKKVLTDSGGVQKEAYILKIPCLTLRKETEWVETVKDEWNILVGAEEKNIIKAIRGFSPKGPQHNYFGSGDASEKITNILKKFKNKS
jgi:UDP-N-acetylglucosamine 2-epimerase